jgi:hypothetical protein
MVRRALPNVVLTLVTVNISLELESSLYLGTFHWSSEAYYRYGALVIMPTTSIETEGDDEDKWAHCSDTLNSQSDAISASARVNVIEILVEERSPPLTLWSETTNTKSDTTMAAVKFSVGVTVHRELCFACTRC